MLIQAKVLLNMNFDIHSSAGKRSCIHTHKQTKNSDFFFFPVKYKGII